MEDAQKDLAKAKAVKVSDYLDVFDNDEGKKVILDLMEMGHILKPLSGLSERDSILNEGKRELVLYILDMITYDVEDIMKLIGTNEKKTKQGDRNENTKEEFDFFND